MIPLKLEISNFLSYRDTAVLNFDGIHLACIAGLNGAGKSSVLDAMTWALFGASRSRSDDDLVNKTAAINGGAAQVNFIFRLEGSVYRILRQKKLRKTAVLEFFMAIDPEMSGWKPLTESKLRQTQAAIEQLLRMNFDTFSNASFLLQGKADEFTTKPPGKRKEILADLLGVSQWNQYKEAAAVRRKEAERRIALLDGLLADIETELGEEEERAANLETTKAALTAVQERLHDKEQVLQQLRRAETAAQQQKQLAQSLADNAARAQQTLDNLRRTRQQRQAEREEYETILAEQSAIAADYAAWQSAESAAQAWQEKADAHTRLQQARRPRELTITQTRSRLEQRRRELAAQAEQAAQAEAEREEVTQTLTIAQARLAQLADELAALAQQEQAWHDARAQLQRLESERDHVRQELSRLQKEARKMAGVEAERTAVAQNRQQAETELAQAAAQVAAIAEKNQQFALNKGELDSLKSEQLRLRAEMEKLKARLDNLAAESGGDCPLCGQPLSAEHRASALAELEAEGKANGDRFRDNKARIQKLEEEVLRLEGELKQRDRWQRDQKTQQERLARAEARLAEIDNLLAEWRSSGQTERLAELEKSAADTAALQTQKEKVAELATAVSGKTDLEKEQAASQKQAAAAEARLAEIERLAQAWQTSGKAALAEVERTLAAADFEPEAQAALADLDAQIEALAYDAAAHEAARRQRDGLADAVTRWQTLQQAQAAVKPLTTTLADLDAQIAAQEQTAADLKKQQETAAAQLEAMQTDPEQLKRVEDAVFQLREEQIAANRRVGAAEQRLGVLDDLRARREKLQDERTEVTQLAQRLKLLEKACGRDGVQALLIEQALPEIEERANELLERLTGGEMRVTFETQRQLKSREGLAETLDIRIIDNAGERPYANFSGGEQFRVNFAIRLSLSQILAKRAGARLQTLVVDEGFGSQDVHGRQRLVEAINTIRDDFARILVITHVAELRDAFPTRIEVEKTITGSRITVV